jgi:hypothetical protein
LSSTLRERAVTAFKKVLAALVVILLVSYLVSMKLGLFLFSPRA